MCSKITKVFLETNITSKSCLIKNFECAHNSHKKIQIFRFFGFLTGGTWVKLIIKNVKITNYMNTKRKFSGFQIWKIKQKISLTKVRKHFPWKKFKKKCFFCQKIFFQKKFFWWKKKSPPIFFFQIRDPLFQRTSNRHLNKIVEMFFLVRDTKMW